MRLLLTLLILAPIALALRIAGADSGWIFLTSAAALIPLSAFLGRATEELALQSGPQLGALLNVTLGNAAELIIAIVAIRKGLPLLVKASISGSILGNVLLVLGTSLVAGGVRNGRQRFDVHLAGIASTMMTLAVVALVIPALFRLGPHRIHDRQLELFSIGVALVLLTIYGLYVLYTVVRRAPAPGAEPAGATARPRWSGTFALGVLAAATAGAVVMSELLIDVVEPVVQRWGVTELFLGFIVVPIVGNTAEHFAAVQAAVRDQMDLSLGIAIGSSLQVALFVAPLLVLVSLALGRPVPLVFNEYELAALAGGVAVASFIAIDGESNWVEGVQLVALYVIVGLGFFFLS